MLVIDYAMGYPEENAGVMSIFTEAGFEVHYRQYYLALVEQDASIYDAITLMGGGDPGMSLQEVDFVINFVSRGKLLILAAPSDTEYGGKRRTNAGIHDRYMFNRVLNRLNIQLYVFAPSIDEGVSLTPLIAYEPTPGHPASQGMTAPMGLRAGTRILVGDGVVPLMVEPESDEDESAVATRQAGEREKPAVRMKRQRIRVQATEALPDEEIELILRGANVLRVMLHYKSDRSPAPVDWNTSQVKGRVVAVAGDTVTVRVPGNRWGAEYAIIGIPGAAPAITFVKRDMPVAPDLSDSQDEASLALMEDAGRLAVMAVARGASLKKGFVLVADRGVLNTLSAPVTPLSLAGKDLPDRSRIAQFLTQVGRYLVTLDVDPASWSPTNPNPDARIPGIQEPKFSVNRTDILPVLPRRVSVVTNRTLPADLIDVPSSAPHESPLRGVWEYVSRFDDRTDSLLSLIKTLRFDFLWTVAPARSFMADSTALARDVLFRTWGRQVADRLSDSSLRWFAGIRAPDEFEEPYDRIVDARGYEVNMPHLLDLKYWEKAMFAPSRELAKFSRATPALAGIVHDWEMHVNRENRSYAPTDAFQDEYFQQYVRYAAHYGFYQGEEFNAFKKLDRKKRFEWLMKSGRLEEYFNLLESRAERFGKLYRSAVDAVNPGLLHGSFMRSPRLSWFHIGFLRGMSDEARPYLLLTYERAPVLYESLLRNRGINVRMIPMALLGLLDPASYESVFREAVDSGGYCLERGLWLVSDPGNTSVLSAPQHQGMTGPQVIDALRGR